MKLNDFLVEILSKNPSLKGVVLVDIEGGKLKFSLPGFSKSGYICLSENESGVIIAKARYGEITEIENYEDIVCLAWDWFIRYRDSFSCPSFYWVDDFKKLGLIEEVQETKYKIKK